jgi:hypothetical protein
MVSDGIVVREARVAGELCYLVEIPWAFLRAFSRLFSLWEGGLEIGPEKIDSGWICLLKEFELELLFSILEKFPNRVTIYYD